MDQIFKAVNLTKAITPPFPEYPDKIIQFILKYPKRRSDANNNSIPDIMPTSKHNVKSSTFAPTTKLTTFYVPTAPSFINNFSFAFGGINSIAAPLRSFIPSTKTFTITA